MTTALLQRSLVTVSLLALTACVTPYPTRYQGGLGGGPANLSQDCRDAMARRVAVVHFGPDEAPPLPPPPPSQRDSLAACLTQRAAAWEGLASANRGATRGAGALAILATATGIGLAAEGDPNHAVVPLGLVTGAAVTGARTYAAPEQAAVAEKAVAAYNCLLSAVAELRAGDNMPAIQAAYDGIRGPASRKSKQSSDPEIAEPDRVSADYAIVWNAPDRIRDLKAGQRKAVQAQVDDVADDAAKLVSQANAALRRIKVARAALRARQLKLDVAYKQAEAQVAQADARLLRQSDLIDEIAIAEITRREPTVYAVAGSARDAIMDVASRAGLGTPKSMKGPGEAPMFPGSVEAQCAAGETPESCALRDMAVEAVERLVQQAALEEASLAAFDAQAAVFDAAVAQSKAADPQIGANCKVAVTEIAALTVSAAELTLSKDGQGAVTLRGGVIPYYPEQPPKGWSVIMSPSGRAVITAPDSAAGSTETLTFYDAAAAQNHVSVTVTVPERQSPPDTDPPDDAGQGNGAETDEPAGGPDGGGQ